MLVLLRRCWGMYSNEFHSSYLREGVTVFVCLLDLRKNYATEFRKIRWKGAHGPRKKKPLDFSGNPVLYPVREFLAYFTTANHCHIPDG